MQQASSNKVIGITAIVIGIASIIIDILDMVLLRTLPYRIGPTDYEQFLWGNRFFFISIVSAFVATMLCAIARKRLLLILIPVALFILFVVSVPAGIHSGGDPQVWCDNNLLEISEAKALLAHELGLTNGTVVTPAQISKYIDGGFGSLKCFDGGTYIIGPIGTEPRCTYHGSTSEIEDGWKKMNELSSKP